ncbi:hypothetical protein STCU_11625 [Strigomonas culicis]|uniref:Uncharacterized protein n=1 Tax=Strigomonas culicis TaxID=28005 RepID=S9UMQ9_9TRYP|nr:hypothetical protein STCU_11625 [Strigomonas culicis]|eukprot:EPY15991.1 hypothetical protein STCU_11625 [Strigomonas culicis]
MFNLSSRSAAGRANALRRRQRKAAEASPAPVEEAEEAAGKRGGQRRVEMVDEPLSEVVQFFSNALQQKGQKPAPPTVLKAARMVSSVTRHAFSPRHQAVLREVARRSGYASHSWLTSAQARRTANTFIVPGATPTTLHLHVERVVPLLALSRGSSSAFWTSTRPSSAPASAFSPIVSSGRW